MSDESVVEKFYYSKESSLAKNRIYIWIGLLIGLIPSIYVQLGRGGSTGLLIFSVLFFVGIGLLVEWSCRKQLRPGQALVTLTDDYIESPNLSGKEKRLRWLDIEKASLDVVQGHRILSFKLIASDESKWKSFFAAKPALALSPFSDEDQVRLIDVVNRRHAKASNAFPEQNGLLNNQLKEEHEFQEKLKSFQPHAWVTYVIVGVNVLVWVWTLMQGASVVNAPADKLFYWGGNAASAIQQGEWWRLCSAMFLHSGLMHVLMNMIGLYTAGVVVERIYGSRLFLIIYFASGLLGNALALNYSAQNAVSVGASGAVFGVAGALLVAVFQHRDKLPEMFSRQTMSGMGVFVLYSLINGFSHQGIDNAAHIGGLIGGCLAAVILPERFDMPTYQRSFLVRAVAVLVVLSGAVLGVAAMAPQATIDQGRIFASARILEQTFKQFDQGIKALQHEAEDIKARRISEREADDRSRTVFAPMFRKLSDEFSLAVLRPDDPRAPFVRDIQRMSELLAESLAMDSVFNEEMQKYDPVNLARADAIQAELIELNERVKNYIASTKKK